MKRLLFVTVALLLIGPARATQAPDPDAQTFADRDPLGRTEGTEFDEIEARLLQSEAVREADPERASSLVTEVQRMLSGLRWTRSAAYGWMRLAVHLEAVARAGGDDAVAQSVEAWYTPFRSQRNNFDDALQEPLREGYAAADRARSAWRGGDAAGASAAVRDGCDSLREIARLSEAGECDVDAAVHALVWLLEDVESIALRVGPREELDAARALVLARCVRQPTAGDRERLEWAADAVARDADGVDRAVALLREVRFAHDDEVSAAHLARLAAVARGLGRKDLRVEVAALRRQARARRLRPESAAAEAYRAAYTALDDAAEVPAAAPPGAELEHLEASIEAATQVVARSIEEGVGLEATVGAIARWADDLERAMDAAQRRAQDPETAQQLAMFHRRAWDLGREAARAGRAADEEIERSSQELFHQINECNMFCAALEDTLMQLESMRAAAAHGVPSGPNEAELAEVAGTAAELTELSRVAFQRAYAKLNELYPAFDEWTNGDDLARFKIAFEILEPDAIAIDSLLYEHAPETTFDLPHRDLVRASFDAVDRLSVVRGDPELGRTILTAHDALVRAEQLSATDATGAARAVGEAYDALNEVIFVEQGSWRLPARIFFDQVQALDERLVQVGIDGEDADRGREARRWIVTVREGFPAWAPDELAVARARLAERDFEEGRYREALTLQEEVLSFWSAPGRRRHEVPLIDARWRLARTLDRMGEAERSREMTRSMLQDQRVWAGELRYRPPSEARESALAELRRMPWAMRVGADATTPEGSIDAELFGALESLRVASTVSSEIAHAAARDPKIEALRDRAAAARRRLNLLGMSPPTSEKAAREWEERFEQLAEARDRAERELRLAIQRAGVTTEPVSVDALAAALAPNAAAVTYFRHAAIVDGAEREADGPELADRLVAFVLVSGGALRRLDLGPALELEELVQSWRRCIGKDLARELIVSPGDKAVHVDEATVGRTLRERLVDPCLEVIDVADLARLHVVLDDFQHVFPLDALPADEERLLGDVLELAFEISLQRIIAPAPPPVAGDALVALGGVDYDARPAATAADDAPRDAAPPAGSTLRGGRPASWSKLFFTRPEVEGVQDLHDGESVLLVGEDATKAALAANAARARYLHLATHGWFAAEAFRSMRDELEADQSRMRDRLLEAEQLIRGYSPDTLCGLVFAGANAGPDDEGRQPGIMTAAELSGLDLSNCEIAVLSACETNCGLRRAGQGIESLQGALHAAGARTTVTSLWSVDDAASCRLMQHFYDGMWERGLDPAVALWEAKSALRKAGAPTKHWAGWVLVGDPERSD